MDDYSECKNVFGIDGGTAADVAARAESAYSAIGASLQALTDAINEMTRLASRIVPTFGRVCGASGRVVWLAYHAKKPRTRKKNRHRLVAEIYKFYKTNSAGRDDHGERG